MTLTVYKHLQKTFITFSIIHLFIFISFWKKKKRRRIAKEQLRGKKVCLF